MYGLIVKFIANPGKRGDLIRILSTGFQDMAGCHSYILAEDVEDDDGVWVTEIWESSEAHAAAIAKTEIVAVIAAAKTQNVSAGREVRVVTEPMGGQGLFKDDGAWRPEPPLVPGTLM